MKLKSRREILKVSAIAAGAALSVGAWSRALSHEAAAPKPPSRRFLDAVAEGDRTAVVRWLDADPGLLRVRDERGRSGASARRSAGM